MLGLLPLTFFVSGQARFLQPMAISIFFGLAVATVLILILVPAAYVVLEDLIAVARRMFLRGAPPEAEGLSEALTAPGAGDASVGAAALDRA